MSLQTASFFYLGYKACCKALYTLLLQPDVNYKAQDNAKITLFEVP